MADAFAPLTIFFSNFRAENVHVPIWCNFIRPGHFQGSVSNFGLSLHLLPYYMYSKTCLKRPLKKNTKNRFSMPIIALCRSKVLQTAILSTFIELPFSIKTFVLPIFKWPLKTSFTVCTQRRLLRDFEDAKKALVRLCTCKNSP